MAADPMDHEHGMLMRYHDGSAGGPWEAAAWWRDDLDEHDRQRLIATWPVTVGSTDGLPTSVRDRANRIVLERAIEDTTADLQRTGWWRWRRKDDLEARLATLNELRSRRVRQVRLPDGTQAAQSVLLHHFDADAGHIAVGYGPVGTFNTPGDPDTADNIVVYVPGTGTDLTGFEASMDRAADLSQTAVNLSVDTAGSTMTVAWLGYDAPDHLLAAASPNKALEGRTGLVEWVNGIWAANCNSPDAPTEGRVPGPTLGLIGHSYGTRVAAEAAAVHPGRVARLVVAGTPGLGAETHLDRARDSIGAGGVTSMFYGRDFLYRGDTWVQRLTRSIVRRQHGVDVTKGLEGCDRYIHVPSREPAARSPWGQLSQAFRDHSGYFNDPQAREILVGAAIGAEVNADGITTSAPHHHHDRAAAGRVA